MGPERRSPVVTRKRRHPQQRERSQQRGERRHQPARMPPPREGHLSRLPRLTVVAIVVVAIGVAGLVRAAIPQSVASSPAQTARSIPTVGASPSGSVNSSPAPSLTITGAFVRQPASPAGPAWTHLTINNTSGIGDTLISVESGDAAKVQLRVGGSRTPLLTGVKIPPHARVTIGAGRTRIVIAKPFAPCGMAPFRICSCGSTAPDR